MDKKIVPYLICPTCSVDRWTLDAYEQQEGRVRTGRLVCGHCAVWYRIEGGILDLLPLSLRSTDRYAHFARVHNVPFNQPGALAGQDEKRQQMEFFQRCCHNYEKKIVNNNFYKAFYEIDLQEWMGRKVRNNALFLDVGCGTGKQSLILSCGGARVIGIDLSEPMLSLAKQKADMAGQGDSVDYILADGENPPFKDGIFDGCILCGTIHHFADPASALVNLTRKIKKGGIFYSNDPHKSALRFIFDFMMKIWPLYEDQAGKTPVISRAQMKEWLQKADIQGRIRVSIYLPPHFLHYLSVGTNKFLLRLTDKFFGALPVLREQGGAITVDGVKN